MVVKAPDVVGSDHLGLPSRDPIDPKVEQLRVESQPSRSYPRHLGDPDNSYILSNRTTYSGPMYKIFTPAELKLWADWIRWLGKEYEAESTDGDADPADNMQSLVSRLSSNAVGVPAHKTAMLGGKCVADWFAAGPDAIMGALGDPANGWVVPGSAATSKFISGLLPSAPAPEDALRGVTIGTQHGVPRLPHIGLMEFNLRRNAHVKQSAVVFLLEADCTDAAASLRWKR